MVRTQIQITEQQAATLRAMSDARHVSIAELIRMSIDNFLERESGTTHEAVVVRAKSVVGRFCSGSTNGSADHDRYLSDAFDHK